MADEKITIRVKINDEDIADWFYRHWEECRKGLLSAASTLAPPADGEVAEMVRDLTEAIDADPTGEIAEWDGEFAEKIRSLLLRQSAALKEAESRIAALSGASSAPAKPECPCRCAPDWYAGCECKCHAPAKPEKCPACKWSGDGIIAGHDPKCPCLNAPASAAGKETK